MKTKQPRRLTVHEAQQLEDWTQEQRGLNGGSLAWLHPSDLYCEIASAPKHLQPHLRQIYAGSLYHKSLSRSRDE